jgi:hypothetical protein
MGLSVGDGLGRARQLGSGITSRPRRLAEAVAGDDREGEKQPRQQARREHGPDQVLIVARAVNP